MKKQISKLSPMTKIIKKSLIKLPTPINISYMWNFGSLLGLMLISQMITGILLSMHYTPNTSMAYESVNHIMREVNMGWLMRNLHMNGASMFFIMIYMHISRGIMYSSPMMKEVWSTGTVLLLLTMATAFLGYVLPWGQMSFWGATVITNLVSAIPIVGQNIVFWLWGGFSVSNATLNRFFSLHYLLPFIIAAMALVHLMMLHEYKSSNPLGMTKKKDMIKFHPMFSWKDLTPMIIMMMSLMMLTSLIPNILTDPENFNMASPLVTPIHIQPEWYFLFAYAILRGIPNKLGGVIALVMSILILMTMSSKKKNIQTHMFNPKKKALFCMMSLSFMSLTWLGANPAEEPFNSMTKLFSVTYFSSILMM